MRILLTTLAGGLLLASSGAMAQEAPKKKHVPLEKTIGQVTATAPVPSLAVINSDGATLEGGNDRVRYVADRRLLSDWNRAGRQYRQMRGGRLTLAVRQRGFVSEV